MLKTILGQAKVTPTVGEEHSRAAHAEEAVGDQHGAVAALVPIEGDHLGADNHSQVAAAAPGGLEHVPGKVEGDDAGAAAHSPEVEAEDVAPHLVVVDDHGREGRGGVEQAAVYHQDPHVLGPYPALVEKLVQGPEDDC